MKKVYGLLMALTLVLLAGCTKVEDGKYAEGTYLGSVQFASYGANYVTTAVVYVGEDGMIKSCFIDSTYAKDSVSTTKKVLKDAYGMKEASAANGTIEGGAEWYEQVKVIEDKVISEQDIDWVSWSDDEKTKLDSVSGVTIGANTYIEAVQNALKQAAK